MKARFLHTIVVLLILTSRTGARTILFVDDHDILYRSGTHRVLQPLARHPDNPLIKPDKPWETQIAWNTVYRDPKTGKYQLWYQAWNRATADKTRHCVVAYAESDDGIHFTKPALDLFPFNDVKQTNIVLLANGGRSDRYANSVVVDDAEKDPAKPYKMAYFDFAKDNGKEYPGLCVAFSPDGIHWIKHPQAPLVRIAYTDYEKPLPFADEADAKPWDVPMTMADAVDVCFDPVRNVWAWYGKMWLDGPAGGMAWKHAMGRCESADFIHWSKPQLVAAPDDLDSPHVEFHTSPVFYYEGVYFCTNQILNRAEGEGVINVELMTSRDGIRWERNFRDKWFIARAPEPGKFDSGSIFTNATPVVLDDEIRFYYGAYAGGATGGDNLTGKSGIGLATLKRDRFAGIEPLPKSDQPTLAKPIENRGQITLKPMALDAVKAITLNADASRGEIRVEILDADGRRLRGFAADDAVPIHGDSLRHAVRWKDKQLSDLPAGQYHLRIHLDHAMAFALTLIDRS